MPPISVKRVGSSLNTRYAHSGASGVSSALIRAVSAAGRRRAPSAMVTDATANTRPKPQLSGLHAVGDDKPLDFAGLTLAMSPGEDTETTWSVNIY